MSDLSEYLANAKGDRSIDDIAKQATVAGHPVSRSLVAKYLRGEHGPRIPEATLVGLAAGFGLDLRELRRLAGKPAGELGPYVPTEAAASLTQQQRNAIDQLIKAFVSEGGQSDGRTPEAEKTPLGDALAQLQDTTAEQDDPPAPRSLADHKRARLDRDALPADEAAYDGDDPEGDE